MEKMQEKKVLITGVIFRFNIRNIRKTENIPVVKPIFVADVGCGC